MKPFVVMYYGRSADFHSGHLARLLENEDATTDFVVRSADNGSVAAEYAELYAVLADEWGKHRECGCECAPLGTMAFGLVDRNRELEEENERLRRENAQLQTALSTLR